jgi:glycine cleavage system aminomethyltransferase T
MAYVPTESHAVGTEIDIDIRGRISKARIVALPFYARGSGVIFPSVREKRTPDPI